MRYLNWISQYNHKELSSADKQAFEHELMDNTRLQAEKAANDLTDALLSAAATDYLIDPAAGSVLEKASGANWWKSALIIAAVLSVFFIWRFAPTSTETKHQNPTPEKLNGKSDFTPDERALPDTLRPVALIAPPASSLKAIESSEQRPSRSHKVATQHKAPPATPEIATVLEEARHADTAQNKGQEVVTSREKIAIYTVRGVMDTILSEGAEIALTATEAIVLKPGFQVKAGTSFKARVNAGPLFEKSGTLND